MVIVQLKLDNFVVNSVDWGRILKMFNKMKSIFGKNSKRLKSVLASVLLSVGCTGTSLANPKSVNSSTEKQTEKNRDLVNTYDVMQIVNMVNNNKKEVGETLVLIITSIFGYKKVESVVSDYMVRRALDKIQDVKGVSDEVLNIADNIIKKYLKIGKRKKIVNNAKKDKQEVFNKANRKGLNFDKTESESYKKFILSAKLVDKTKERALSKLQLSADEWFTKLGGTKKDIDIDKYKEPDLSKISEKVKESIEKDVPRSSIWENDTNYNQKIALIDEILKKFEIEEFQGYTQGYNFFASVVVRKFTEGDKQMQKWEQFSKEKKAKIYYVFKTIVQTVVNYSIGKNGINYGNQCQTLNSLYDRMLLSFCKRNNVNEVNKDLFLGSGCEGVVWPIMVLDYLKPESQIFLWDSIISEIKDEKFDPNVALEKIFDVWFARALQVQEEYISSGLYKHPGGILGLHAFMKNDSI